MATAPRRDGFTLIELLIVMIVIAILATIGINRFWEVKDRSFVAAMKSDIRNFAAEQESYFQKNFAYATTPASLSDFVPSPGVSITVTYTQTDGWAATTAHSSLPGRTCGLAMGNAPVGNAPPATQSGVIACN